KKKNKEDKKNIKDEIVGKETMQAVLAIVFFLIALLFILAPFHLADPIGETVYRFLRKWFGLGYFLIPISSIMTALAFLKGVKTEFKISK
ncbi:hypothetical protein ACI3PL_22565, partial [Lacticaseibacillus paracasei]